MSNLITSNLQLELEKSLQEINRWEEKKLTELQSTEANFRQEEEEAQYTIQSLQHNDQQLNQSLKFQQMVKVQQSNEYQRYQDDIANLQGQYQLIHEKYQQLHAQEEQIYQQVESVQSQYKQVKTQYDQLIHDVTNGINNYYQYLGLEFQRVHNQYMKFTFTCINEANPLRQYYFIIYVNSNDQYDLIESNPMIESGIISPLLARLNQTSDISHFVFHMRKCFVEISKSENMSMDCM